MSAEIVEHFYSAKLKDVLRKCGEMFREGERLTRAEYNRENFIL